MSGGYHDDRVANVVVGDYLSPIVAAHNRHGLPPAPVAPSNSSAFTPSNRSA